MACCVRSAGNGLVQVAGNDEDEALALGRDGAEYAPKAALWLDRFDKLATGHTAMPSGPRPGGAMADAIRPLAPAARRW